MRKLIILVLALCLVLHPSPALSDEQYFEHTSDGVYTIVNETDPGEVIFTTGMTVTVGDQYQTADDRLFEVVRVDEENRRGEARFVEKVVLDSPRLLSILEAISSGKASMMARENGVTVGIYQTHTAESYVPSQGRESIRGKGGILQVGKAAAEALQAAGARAIYSDNKHDPHDAAAYSRSRRTAQALLKQGSAALLDVHRDAGGGAQVYTSDVHGERMAQIRLVVGRQNPNMQANKQFAQEIKRVTDEQHPNLIKGIFFARGGYNQDLTPRNLLLEVGNESVTLQNAKDGVSLFAKAYAQYLGASIGGAGEGGRRESSAGTVALGWILGLVAIGGIAFLFLSTGNREELLSKARTFFSREFGDLLRQGDDPRKRDR